MVERPLESTCINFYKDQLDMARMLGMLNRGSHVSLSKLIRDFLDREVFPVEMSPELEAAVAEVVDRNEDNIKNLLIINGGPKWELVKILTARINEKGVDVKATQLRPYLERRFHRDVI